MREVRLVINIVGAALLVGIALRYSTQLSGLVSTGTQAFSNAYSTVSLQNVPLPTPVRPGPQWGGG